MNFFTLFLEFLKAAFLSFGGLGNLPILLQSLVHNHEWATEQTFGQALAVGRISPGPNGLYVVALGELLLGPPGAIAATLASLIPALLVIPLSAVYNRVERHPRVAGATRMLGFAVVGTLIVTALQLVKASASSSAVDLVIALAAPTIVLLCPKWNPVFILAVAAIVGLIVHY